MRMRAPGAILLVSCYELGHQPLGLASPLAFLERAGFRAEAADVAVERLDAARLEQARFVGISAPMHTAMRLGLRVLERVRQKNPSCHVAFYGLYASLNAGHLFARGADSVVGGEYEESLVELIRALDEGRSPAVPGVGLPDRPAAPTIRRLSFAVPKRDALPPIDRYARIEGGGLDGAAGYVAATRGCLHRCRHCPITPVYDGRFFAVPLEVVLEDVRSQVALGAVHVTFGDPDFLNGPSHALRVARAVHAAFPALTFDFTTKVEHVLRHRALFAELRALGGVFVISAFESTSDVVLEHLAKGHTLADELEALAIVRAAGMTLRPTWVPFTPWTTLDDYLAMLDLVRREDLVGCIAPVQYGIRLLVPPGSALLGLPALESSLGPLDEEALTHRWTHPDPRMDRLQRAVAAEVERAEARKEEPEVTFHAIEHLAAGEAGRKATSTPWRRRGEVSVPRLTEAWFC